jgi:hypothetical protein
MTAWAEENDRDDASLKYAAAEAKDLGLPTDESQPGGRA